MQTVEISLEEYRELVERVKEREVMLLMMRNNYCAERNSAYMDCIDMLEMFDPDFEEFK